MGEWRTDPTFAMCVALADGAQLSSFAGGPYDVRAVVAAIRPEAKDGFLLGEVPWEHFPQGNRVREAVHLLHTGGSPAGTGTGVVGGMCANDMRAAAVLAVPFLIRIAADTLHPHRADALAEASAPARARHFGVASRDELLLHRGDTPYGDLYDDYGVEVTWYPAGWSVAAARAAITADAALLEPLLDDPDPAIRIGAAYALATATDPGRTVRAAFRTRLAAEPDPIVRAALVLATAEATRAHPHPPTTAWVHEQWEDRTQAPELRLAAAIGWLCLTEEPAPDDLRAAVDDLATDERAHTMDDLPWMAAVGGSGEPGLRRCTRKMLHPEQPDPADCDDPWCPHH
ncbi:HEAT repeat domain-containing protein [Streptomyces sp. NPDC059752]|uniref:HEAT repeat domain-containing protein n=1 Tax=unclassified Streptomyces TaxID=2593676 RepID=UPI003658F60F